jgi:calcineurin-like phosphoesterase
MMALYLDGRVGALIGTHTHVQTADDTILPGGTAYITDVGMCGPTGGVIGTEPEPVRTRFVAKMPARFGVHKGPPMINAAFLALDEETGKAINIRRIWLDE